MSHSKHATSILAAALALCAAPVSSNAAIKADAGTFKPAVVQEHDGGRIVLAAQRGGGAARAGGAREGAGNRAGGAREAAGNRAGGAGVEHQAANRQVRSSATNNINHNRETNANVSRNVNARNINVNSNNVNINRDVDVNVHRDYYDGWDDHWHPVAAAAAVTATAALVGSMVRTLPPSCSTVVVNGVGYSQCGSTWYLPQYSGTNVQYVVVNAPR